MSRDLSRIFLHKFIDISLTFIQGYWVSESFIYNSILECFRDKSRCTESVIFCYFDWIKQAKEFFSLVIIRH